MNTKAQELADELAKCMNVNHAQLRPVDAPPQFVIDKSLRDRILAALRSPTPDVVEALENERGLAYLLGRYDAACAAETYVRDHPPRAVGDLTGRDDEVAGMKSAHELIAAGMGMFVSAEGKAIPLDLQFDNARKDRLRNLNTQGDTGQ
ncbi:hypothetical protein [Qipengyuania atrilutea]|uniref:Uncharacterized protein n=1 Tax=Qipengyuania atrilutea TaxID=2744473 RepID=A0A850H6D4_9SPHN|nr:hypothetical protein [Actirhodobacter atriluteus]NVD45722.1 hypothetical protein [Actirhodobacter atriluteus]